MSAVPTHIFCLRSEGSSEILQVVVVTAIQAMLLGVDGHVDDGQENTQDEVPHSNDLPVVPTTAAVPERVRVHTHLLRLLGDVAKQTHSRIMATGHRQPSCVHTLRPTSNRAQAARSL